MKDKDLNLYYKNMEVIDATAKQIIHDFELLGMEISFSGNRENAYRELFDQIHPHIKQIMTRDKKRLLVIFQKIDLSESQVRRLFSDGDPRLSERLTDMIIRRELQKVVIRRHFRNEGDDAK